MGFFQLQSPCDSKRIDLQFEHKMIVFKILNLEV